jgi:hypothetical protein
MDITGRGYDNCVYVLKGDRLVRAIYEERRYLAAIVYGIDIVAISEEEARKTMIKQLESNGYFSDYFDAPNWASIKTDVIYDLYLEKVC